MYPIYSAWVLDATTLLPNAALKGQQVQVVTRNTTTPYPIFNAAGDPIASSLVTVTEAASTPTVYIDTESPETVYLDWYDAGTGQRGPIWFEEVSRESAMASAASSDASAASSAASAASAAATATDVAALRGWVEKGVTTRNVVLDPLATNAARWVSGAGTSGVAEETMVTGATDGPLLPDGRRISTYARYTWTTGNSGGSPSAGYTAIDPSPVTAPLLAGSSFGAGIYVRSSVAIPSAFLYVSQQVAGADGPNVNFAPRAIAANTWTRVGGVGAVSTECQTFNSVGVALASFNMPTGGILEVTVADAVPGVTVLPDHWDGDSLPTNLVGYGWEGARNNSVSRRIDMRLVRAIKNGTTTLFPDANGTIDLGTVGGGTMDHGQLSGLGDDDHPQYLTSTRAQALFYTRTQVDALVAAAIETAYERARQRQYHTGLQGIGSIDGLSSALAARPQWQDVETGNEPRPTGSDRVFWVRGATQPVNIGPYDLHLAGAPVTPGDTTPPSAPGTPTTSGVAATSLTLTWTAATDNVAVTGYRVRINGSTVLAAASGLSRLITGLAPSTEYTFEVAARDANANWGPYSPPSAPVTTSASSDTEDPSIPDNLVASAITAAGFTVSWDASTDNVGVTGYRVLLNGVQYGSIVTDTFVVVTGRTAGTLYGVTVQATDAAGNWSDPSDELPVTTSAGGSLPTHSVFATPPATPVKTVEASPYEHATGFYTYGAPATNGWKVKGARLYVPAGISVPTSCEVNLYVPASGSAPVLGTPTKTATMSGITAGAWNTVNFPSVEPIDPAEFFWIGIKFADGTWLGISTFSDGFVTAADGSKLALSDRELGGGIVRNYRRIGTGSTVALTGGTERDVWFGMDAIVEEA